MTPTWALTRALRAQARNLPLAIALSETLTPTNVVTGPAFGGQLALAGVTSFAGPVSAAWADAPAGATRAAIVRPQASAEMTLRRGGTRRR